MFLNDIEILNIGRRNLPAALAMGEGLNKGLPSLYPY